VSMTKFVKSAKQGFWAYDVALGVFLRHLIEVAEASPRATTSWLSNAVSSWRVVACIPDLGLDLDAGWSAEQRQALVAFAAFADEAWARLATRDSIPAEEIVRWRLLEDERIFTVARRRCSQRQSSNSLAR
jgi:hypothetical protein